MKSKNTVFILLFFSGFLAAQQHDNVWLFADLGIHSSTVNFSNGFPEVSELSNEITDLVKSSAMISDSSGNLILYTNGCNIYGADNDVIENGNMINPGETWDNYCNFNSSYPTAIQSSSFLPWPGNSQKYILFHRKISVVQLPSGSIEVRTEPLYYSTISFEDNPEGQVVDKNIILYDGSPRVESGSMTANKHANGKDWWITNRLEDGGGFLKYLLTPNGIEGPFIQEIGWYPENYQNGGGECE
ncbi:MAG: hypothetical protein AAGI38_25420, partial [Bacteroidota bacterium]